MIASQPKQSLSGTETAGAPAPIGAIFAGDDFDRDVWSVFGAPIDLITEPEAVLAIETAARDRRPLSFVTPNVNFLVRAHQDPQARRHIVDTDLSLVDGAPLVALGRLIGVPVRERCAGSDVFDALRRRAGFPGRRLRVFFFGGRDGAAAAAAAAVDAEKRGVESAGCLNPGHGDLEEMSSPAIIEAINAARADFVLVALGAAKGQAWIARNRARLEAPVVAHLGAVVDFAAGSIVRAPRALRRAGLEWAWRIKEDPALWRRYWTDALALASIVGRNFAASTALRAAGPASPARAEIGADERAVSIILSGDLVAPNRDVVRRAFRKAAAEARDVNLDLRGARSIDASFLGLVLMLEKRLREKGAVIRVAGATRAQRRLFSAHAMNYEDARLFAAASSEADPAIAAMA